MKDPGMTTKYLHSIYENAIFIPIREMIPGRAEKLQDFWVALSKNPSYSTREKMGVIKKLNYAFSKARKVRLTYKPDAHFGMYGWDERNTDILPSEIPTNEETMNEFVKGESNLEDFWDRVEKDQNFLLLGQQSLQEEAN